MEAKVMEGIMKFEIGSPKPDVCHLGIAHSKYLNRILDNETTWDSSCTHLEMQALTIQRAWRNYKGKCSNELNANRPVPTCETIENLENRKEVCLSGTSSEPDVSEADSGNQAMSVSSPEESLQNLPEADDFLAIAEPRNDEGDKGSIENTASDGDDPEETDSELSSRTSPVVKDCQSLLTSKISLPNKNAYSATTQHSKALDDTSEEIAKQVRKHNYLTMAQEFASFKKLNPDALPYNMHRTHQQPISDDETSVQSFTETGENNRSGQQVSDDCRSALKLNSDDERNELPPDSSFSAECDKLLSDFEYMPKTDVPDILKMDASFTKNSLWNEKNSLFWNLKEPKGLNNYDLIEHFHPKDSFDTLGFKKPGEFASYELEQSVDLKDCAIIHEQSQLPSDDVMHINESRIPKNDNCLTYATNEHHKTQSDVPKNVIMSKSSTKMVDKSNKAMNVTNKFQAGIGKKENCSKPISSVSKFSDRSSLKCRGKAEKTLANSRSQSSSYHRSKVMRNHDSSSRRKDSKTLSPEFFGEFDVYNIETAMPTIDWAAMEEHLAKAAKEEELLRRQRRNDREEIRRRLAMGSDTEEYYGGERMTRKPSLQTRLQSGMNLQICFLNETAGEHENAPAETDKELVLAKNSINKENQETTAASKASSIPMLSLTAAETCGSNQTTEEMDFVTRQAKLQAEARLALAQAKEMAHMQMEIEKQRKKKSPITEMVGIAFPDGRKRASRQVLNEMNLAQLQVIVNDLHTQIESLNEELVRLLLERDDLHMEQDSMLVDIEDLTRYLGAKDRAIKENQAETDTSSSKLSISCQKPLTPKLIMKLKK